MEVLRGAVSRLPPAAAVPPWEVVLGWPVAAVGTLRAVFMGGSQ